MKIDTNRTAYNTEDLQAIIDLVPRSTSQPRFVHLRRLAPLKPSSTITFGQTGSPKRITPDPAWNQDIVRFPSHRKPEPNLYLAAPEVVFRRWPMSSVAGQGQDCPAEFSVQVLTAALHMIWPGGRVLVANLSTGLGVPDFHVLTCLASAIYVRVTDNNQRKENLWALS